MNRQLFNNNFAALALLALVLPFLYIAAGGQSIQLHTYLLDQQKPSLALRTILEITGIKQNGTLEAIVDATQKEQPTGFIRPKGKERWEIPDIHEDKRDALLDLLRQLNALSTLIPSQTHYTYAIIHGATLPCVRNRILFLAEQYKQGIRFNEVVLLSGKRILTDMEKSELNNQAETEYDMMKTVWNQVDIPHELKTLPILFIDAPMQEKNGIMVRPTTSDTINTWLSYKPKPGPILAISNQPFCGYQDSVMRTYLPDSFELETVGPGAGNAIKISVLLDNLARWLYQELQRNK